MGLKKNIPTFQRGVVFENIAQIFVLFYKKKWCSCRRLIKSNISIKVQLKPILHTLKIRGVNNIIGTMQKKTICTTHNYFFLILFCFLLCTNNTKQKVFVA